MRYRDRHEAGRVLGERLAPLAGRSDVVVLGLPRGGVPVAWEVARRLSAPLDVFVVRKLGLPGHEELAMGAIASSGVRRLDPEVVCAATPEPFRAVGLWYDDFSQTTDEEVRELLDGAGETALGGATWT